MKEFFAKLLTFDNLLSILLILIGVISAVIARHLSKKNGNTNGQVALWDKIPELVVKAETLFGRGRGTDKLQWVLTELRLYALQNKIKVDDAVLEQKINTIVDVSNNININKSATPNNASNDANITTNIEDKQNTIANIKII